MIIKCDFNKNNCNDHLNHLNRFDNYKDKSEISDILLALIFIVGSIIVGVIVYLIINCEHPEYVVGPVIGLAIAIGTICAAEGDCD